jgi:PhnB protein
MQLSTNLSFNGDCEAAFKFYQQCLGGRIQTMMTWGESPMADQVPAEWRDKIIHTSLLIGEASILGSDAPPGRFEQPKGFAVTVHVNDIAEGERIFNALAEKGQIQMPFAKTFWAAGFGMCVDKFGVPWMVNCAQAG